MHMEGFLFIKFRHYMTVYQLYVSLKSIMDNCCYVNVSKLFFKSKRDPTLGEYEIILPTPKLSNKHMIMHDFLKTRF